jgi:hypothetical protein
MNEGDYINYRIKQNSEKTKIIESLQKKQNDLEETYKICQEKKG